MGEVKTLKPEEQTKKLSYEQLEQVAHQLSEQTRQLYAKVQELSENNFFKRLDYLFEVLKYQMCFDETFVTQCVQEIKEKMTLEEEKEEKETIE